MMCQGPGDTEILVTQSQLGTLQEHRVVKCIIRAQLATLVRHQLNAGMVGTANSSVLMTMC